MENLRKFISMEIYGNLWKFLLPYKEIENLNVKFAILLEGFLLITDTLICKVINENSNQINNTYP